MKHACPESECLKSANGPKSRRIVRKGFYFRRSDGQRVRRLQCRNCGKNFSSGGCSSRYRQKKRQINHRLALLLNSGVSQRRAAHLLRVNRKTVVRKFRFLAQEARNEHAAFIAALSSQEQRIGYVQFDDLETSEHSKCKPLSVALAVEPKTRKILGFQVSQMPAKGHLARVAYQRYGPRNDERPQGWNQLLASLKSVVAPDTRFLSDENPHYPPYVKRHFPKGTHECVKGQRGCVAGQGELKKIGFDPLFSLNHTCAMLRANLNRLFRRTWCTTKTRAGLIDHLSLYVSFHNQVLTGPCTR